MDLIVFGEQSFRWKIKSCLERRSRSPLIFFEKKHENSGLHPQCYSTRCYSIMSDVLQASVATWFLYDCKLLFFSDQLGL